MRQEIAGAVSEIDLAQIALLRTMTPAERVRQAADLIDASERVGAYRLRARQPELSIDEALRIVRSGLVDYETRQKPWQKRTLGS
jgi:hypothetical protein